MLRSNNHIVRLATHLSYCFLINLTFNFLTACSVFAPITTPNIHTYQIAPTNKESKNYSCVKPLTMASLQISVMKVDQPYDSQAMYYTKEPFELNVYSYHRWVSIPSVMFTQAILEKLAASCIYKTVVSSEFMIATKYRLTTDLLELNQVIDQKQSTVNLKIIAQLIDNQNNTVIYTKVFQEHIAATASAKGFIEGSNQATTLFLNDLITWLTSITV